jgi:hypothetical protein
VTLSEVRICQVSIESESGQHNKFTWPLTPCYRNTFMSIFEDTFTVTEVDPDGKVFERGKIQMEI